MGPEAYTQGQVFHREKLTLFSREWLPFCAEGQLEGPGAFVSHTIGGWPVVAVRGPDGTARAFRNVCRHQQMPVVEQAAGRCDRLRCRYHGWVYELDGRLAEAPPAVAPADPDPARTALQGLDLAASGPLLFLRIEPGETAAPATPGLGGGARFAEAVATDVAANWKAAIESLLAAPGGWRFLWPLAFLREDGASRIVRQVVPRSFLRTRFIDLCFDGAAPDPARSAAEKAAAEARHVQLAAGEAPAPSAEVAAFRAQVEAACG